MRLSVYGAAVAYVLAEMEGKPAGACLELAADEALCSPKTVESWLNPRIKGEKGKQFRDAVAELRKETFERVKAKALNRTVRAVEGRVTVLERRQKQLSGQIDGMLEKLEESPPISFELRQLYLRELRQFMTTEQGTLKQIAVELGQWSEKREFDWTALTDEQLVALAKSLIVDEEVAP